MARGSPNIIEARERKADQQPKMDGGLNTVSDESVLLPNQLRRTTNGRLTDYGAITKRGGTRRSSSAVLSAHDVQNGYTWRKDSGSPEIMAIANGVLYTTTYGTLPWTWTAESGALSTTELPTLVQFRDGTNDVVYIGDGGLLNKWDGTTLTTNIAGTVGAKMLAVHNQRLWSCGCGSAPDSVFYSGLNNGDSLANASYSGTGGPGGQIVVRTFGDEVIVGLASVNTSLLIFHRRGISRITGYGQDDITVAPQGVTADVGTISAGSIVSVGNVAYFISERGLYRCNEAEVAPVGTAETPDVLLPIIRTLTSAQFDLIRAGFNRATRELWITLPGIGCYQYHTVLNAWSGPWDTGYVAPDTTALWETLNASGLPVMLKGDVDGWVTLCDATDTYLDNVSADGTGGERYALTAQLHRMYCGDDAEAKALRWIYVTASLRGSDQTRVEWSSGDAFGSFSLPPSADETWGGSGTVWGTGTWGGPGSQSYRVPCGGTGYYFDISIIDSGEALPIFSRVQLEAFALGRR